jgi:hypothetical protein
VLHNHEVAFIIKWDAQIVQERIGGLPHHHGTEELPAEPSSSSRCDASFDDGNFKVWTLFAEHVGGAESATASTDDDDVGLGVAVQVGEVAAGW